jgi:hypothetical protein
MSKRKERKRSKKQEIIKNKKLQREIKAKKKASWIKLEEWKALPKEQYSEERKKHLSND